MSQRPEYSAGQMDINTTDLFNTKYYVKIIAITVLYTIVKIILISLNGNDAAQDDDDDPGEILGNIVKGLVLVILSLIFIFTNLEAGLSDFGFVIRGKTIGDWVYGAYAAWSGAIIISFLASVVELISTLTILPVSKND